MSSLVAIRLLLLEDTVPAERVGHRLALGVQFLDSLNRLPVDGPLTCDLDAIGARPLPQRCEAHSQGRQALRHSGRLAKLLARAVDLAESTSFKLRGYGRRDPRSEGYTLANDPRHYVPRRLALTPVLVDGVPPASRDNIRQAWLWPGAAYPVPANATALRGRVQHGPDLDHAAAVPWSRLVVTHPGPGPANFATETKVAWGHGDDRGEFLILLGAAAVPGGVLLPASLDLRLWVFLPPPGVELDPADPLSSLPLEDGGTAALNEVLRGTAIPPGYLQQAAIDLSVKPGGISSIAEATLLYG
jgi:hypothetical protein